MVQLGGGTGWWYQKWYNWVVAQGVLLHWSWQHWEQVIVMVVAATLGGAVARRHRMNLSEQ